MLILKVLVSGSDGEFVPINIEDIAEVVEVDEDGSSHRTSFLKESSSDPILGSTTKETRAKIGETDANKYLTLRNTK